MIPIIWGLSPHSIFASLLRLRTQGTVTPWLKYTDIALSTHNSSLKNSGKDGQESISLHRDKGKRSLRISTTSVLEIVIVSGTLLPRSHWHLGRILEVTRGDDGVKTKDLSVDTTSNESLLAWKSCGWQWLKEPWQLLTNFVSWKEPWTSSTVT